LITVFNGEHIDESLCYDWWLELRGDRTDRCLRHTLVFATQRVAM
jgi:hypothetical protein